MPVSLSHPSESQPRPQGIGLWDWICLAVVVLMMAALSYHHSHNRMFWTDEVMGWLVIRDKTFLGMMQKWQAGVDSGSLFQVVAGRLWMQVFGPSEVSLRAFSATGVAASFVILWFCARRFFSFSIVALCLPFLFFSNMILNWQYSNGRMYGAFMASTALVAYAFLRADPARPLRTRTLVFTFFAHAFLMSTHILGPLYSGAFIAGLIAQDLWARTFRPRLYLSAFAGWIVLLVSYKNILGTMAVGKQKYWTERPTPADFVQGFYVWGNRLGPVLGVLVLTAVVAVVLRRRRKPSASTLPDRTPLYFLLASFYSVVIIAYLVSLVTTSIYFNRYLLPVLLGDALLMCLCADLVQRDLLRNQYLRIAAVAAVLLLFADTFIHQYRFPFALPRANYTPELLADDPERLPIVFTAIGKFAEMEFYQHGRVPMAVPLGYPVFTVGAQIMQHWREIGWYPGEVLTTDEILSRYPTFLLVNVPGSDWTQKFLANNPRYTMTLRGKIVDADLYLVQTNPGYTQTAAAK